MASALGLYTVAPGSNPVLTSGLDLFPVVPDSILPRFVNSQLPCCLLPVGVLIVLLLSLNWSLSELLLKWGACELA